VNQDVTAEEITRYIEATFEDVDVVRLGAAATFFSLDPEDHWPNFATIVTTDDFDQASNLGREGVYRMNIGVLRPTFERLVGGMTDPDYTALDRVLPHPVYAAQRWVCILNPSRESFEALVKPLLGEAYGILARRRAARS